MSIDKENENKPALPAFTRREDGLVLSKNGDLVDPRSIIDNIVEKEGTTLIERFYHGKDEKTVRSYGKSLETFAEFLGVTNIDGAVDIILSCEKVSELISLGEGFKKKLLADGLAASTINTRLTALRSLTKLLFELSMLPWSLSIKDVPINRDPETTMGPPIEDIKRVVGLVARDTSDAGIRDLALFTVFLEFGLRRGEVHTLDLEHIDDNAQGIRLFVHGKKRVQREWTPNRASEEGSELIRSWVNTRGQEPGPLFISYKPAKKKLSLKDRRLSDHGIWQIINKRARNAQVGPWKCHGLRHAAITNFLDQTNGDLRAAMAFARHKNLNTTCIYDDGLRLAVSKKSKKAASAWWEEKEENNDG